MKPRTPIYISIFWVFVVLFVVYYMFVQNSSFLTSPYFWGTSVIAIILTFIHSSIGDIIENEKFKKLSDEERKAYLEAKKQPYFKSLYQSAFQKQTAKEEKDMLIDHGFDGIMELDNQLPKWWLGLFWFGIAYCVVYILAFSFTDFAHQGKEYDEEYKHQTAAIAEYMKTAPQATLENAKYSADNIAAGQEVFKTNCVSCHGEGGKGGIGPNLTDNFWVNQPEKTLFKNVFHMAENGSPNNPAMQAFGKNGVITGNDIQNVAAYVYHINQEQSPITTAQGGAAPQGTEAHWEK